MWRDGPLYGFRAHIAAALGASRLPMGRPTVLQFPVNDVCNAKCQMCNIWQRRLDEQIDLDAIRRFTRDPLFRTIRSVGLNGGEPTLRKDLPDIATALIGNLPSLRTISLITNALVADRTIEAIEQLSNACGKRVNLDVMVSLDGVGMIHDLVRGSPGNFDNACRVLDHLKSMGERVQVRLGCTIVRDNVGGLHDLHEFALSRDVYIKYRLGVPHKRLYKSVDDPPVRIGKRSWIDVHPFELDPQQRWHVGQFLLGLCRHYETSDQQLSFYRSLVGQLVYGRKRTAGCDWSHRGATLTSRGEVLFCAISSDPFADIGDPDLEARYFQAEPHLDTIVQSKCGDCMHDYMGLPRKGEHLRWMVRSSLRKLHWDENLLGEGRIRRALARGFKRSLSDLRFQRHRRRALERFQSIPPSPGPGRGVVICGWYGTETVGDKAILASICDIVRERHPGEPVHIASLDPALTRLTVTELAELEGCEVFDATDLPSVLPGKRLLIFGGGPLMSVREVSLMEAAFGCAKTIGLTTIVAGCGVGPVGTKLTQASIRNLLQHSDHRIYRDQESLKEASGMGIDTAQDLVASDPAVHWLSKTGPCAPGNHGDIRIGICLRDWPADQYAASMSAVDARNISARFASEASRLIEMIANELPDSRIVPIPFCTHDIGGDDRIFLRSLIRGTSTACHRSIDMSMVAMDRGIHATVDAIRGCSHFIAMRFHSLVFADTLGIPCYAIDYTMGKGKIANYVGQKAIPNAGLDAFKASEVIAWIHEVRKTRPANEAKDSFRDALRRKLDLASGSPT